MKNSSECSSSVTSRNGLFGLQEQTMEHKDEDLVFSLFFIVFALFIVFLILIGIGLMVWSLI